MLVVNAHLLQDTSGEGFAVRLFRKGNQRGFVRALSDQPSAFVSGFNKASSPYSCAGAQDVLLDRHRCITPSGPIPPSAEPCMTLCTVLLLRASTIVRTDEQPRAWHCVQLKWAVGMRRSRR